MRKRLITPIPQDAPLSTKTGWTSTMQPWSRSHRKIRTTRLSLR